MDKAFNGVMFRLNGITCAIDALAVREIVGGSEWSPRSYEGEEENFIEIRGKSARVIDLRKWFGFSPGTGEGLNSFIAVHVPDGEQSAALWVDTLLDLVRVPGAELDRRKDAAELPLRYVEALFNKEEVLVHVLDLTEIFKDVLSKGELALQDKVS